MRTYNGLVTVRLPVILRRVLETVDRRWPDHFSRNAILVEVLARGLSVSPGVSVKTREQIQQIPFGRGPGRPKKNPCL